MKMTNLSKWAAVIACGCLVPLALQAIPINYVATQANEIGEILPGVDASSATGTADVNKLLTFASGGADPSGGGYTYTVVNSGSYSTAFYDYKHSVGGDDIVDLGAGGYEYLAVKYDGANGPLLVWGISGVTDGVSVPDKYVDSSGNTTQWGPNVYYLFTATQVPDGGTTIAMLGFGLIGLSLLRRKIACC
jgi:VPDSG-CTERM motif